MPFGNKGSLFRVLGVILLQIVSLMRKRRPMLLESAHPMDDVDITQTIMNPVFQSEGILLYFLTDREADSI